jgi:ribosome modulation factor
MVSPRDRRDGRKSTVRRRAEGRASGFSTTCLKIPENVDFFEVDEGMFTFNILGFIAKEGNPNADPGELHYERTYHRYRAKIGVEEKKYICPSKTFGEKDFIQEYRARKAKTPNLPPEEADALKALSTQEMQIYLLWQESKPDRFSLMDIPYHNFGKLLEDRIKGVPEERGWDWFYWMDETGFTLEVTFKQDKFEGNPYIKAVAIDFLPRKSPLPEKVQNHGYCLDDFLRRYTYDELKGIFLGDPNYGDEAKEQTTSTSQSEPSTSTTTTRSADPVADCRAMGDAAFHNGQKRDQNPYDVGGARGQAWLEGWTKAAEAAPKTEEKKEQLPETSGKKITVESLGLERMQEVIYKGETYEFLRATDDSGTTVTLIDAKGEVAKGIPIGEISVKGKSSGNGQASTKTETKTETKSEPEIKKEPETVAASSEKFEEAKEKWDVGKGWD